MHMTEYTGKVVFACLCTELDASRRHEVLLGKAAELEQEHAETVRDKGSLAAENEALKVSVGFV